MRGFSNALVLVRFYDDDDDDDGDNYLHLRSSSSVFAGKTV